MKDVKDLIAQINITDLIADFSPLTKTGSSYKTLCNVHGDRSPSLSINPRKQIYKCFVCDHGGNALDYLIWAQKFSYPDAIKYLAKLSGEDLSLYSNNYEPKIKYNEKQLNLINCLKDVTNLFSYYLNLYEKQEPLKTFLKQRNLTSQEIVKYQIGYAPDSNQENYLNTIQNKNHSLSTLINAAIISETNQKLIFNNRLIFPIFDEDENVIALSGRAIDQNQEPKYFHSKESLVFKKNQTIYNYHRAKKYDELIIVEGFMDVIAFNKINQDNAIALMGLSLNSEQIQKIKKHKKVFLCLDQDEAGIKTTINMIEVLMKNNIKGSVLKINNYKDADELVNSSDGINRLIKVYQNPIAFVDYIYQYFLITFDLTKIDEIKLLITELKRFTKYLDHISLETFLIKLSDDTKLNLDILKKELINQTNLVKFDDYKLDNSKRDDAYSNHKIDENLNETKQELVNIQKLLVALYQNPSLLQLITDADKLSLLKPEYQKMYDEISGLKPIEEKTEIYLKKLENKWSHLIPKTELEFSELIERISKYDKYVDISKTTTQLINSSQTSKEEKINILELKREEFSKKIK